MGQAERFIAAVAVPAAWGPVLVAASERGIVAIELTTTAVAFATGLEARFGRPVCWFEADGSPALDTGPARRLVAAVAALGAAFAGDDGPLAVLELDLGDRPAWDRSVLSAVQTIPRGRTRSYGEIARQVGKAGAARAVGGAVGRNPVALAIPCHRVIAGDGTLGGYGGGWWGERERLLDLKADLLAAEGRHVRRRPSEGMAGR